MWEIWANSLLPMALKSGSKSNKSPNLVTLLIMPIPFASQVKSLNQINWSTDLTDSNFDGTKSCQFFHRHKQCYQIWRNFAILAKVYKSLANFVTVYFLFGKMLWQTCDIIGLIFIVANGQILKTESNHLVTLAVSYNNNVLNHWSLGTVAGDDDVSASGFSRLLEVLGSVWVSSSVLAAMVGLWPVEADEVDDVDDDDDEEEVLSWSRLLRWW